MSKVENLREPVAECANEYCEEPIMIGQLAYKFRGKHYCCVSCLLDTIGAEAIIL